MLIERIELEAFGNFRERIALGPLQRGLNVLAQPNEWGKSTVIHALCRGFFEKYTAAGQEMEQCRPAGSLLSPRVEVIFAARGDRDRLRKQFFQGRSCQLARAHGDEWLLLDEADRADQRVRELLGAPPLDGRRARAETWGLIRYLWCRQDDAVEWPCWEGDCGDAARRKLATVEIDSAVRTLAERLKERAAVDFTATGQVKRGSPLFQREEAVAQWAAQVAALQQRQSELESLQRDSDAAGRELLRLQRESVERASQARVLQTEALAAEKALADLQLAESEWQRADASLQAIQRDRQALAQIDANLALEAKAHTDAKAQEDEAALTLQRCEERARQARTGAREQAQIRADLGEKGARLRRWRQSLAYASELARLHEQAGRVSQMEAELAGAEQRLAAVPALDEADLKRARDLDRQLGAKRARLQAAGLLIRLDPERVAVVEHVSDGSAPQRRELPSGAPETLRAARSLRLHLEGWGQLFIESGAEETAALQEEIGAAEVKLAALLAKGAVTTLSEAEAHAQQAQAARGALEAARAELKGLLADWPSPAELAAEIARLTLLVAQTAPAPASDSPAPADASDAASPTEEAALAVAEQAAEQAAQSYRRQAEAEDQQLQALRQRIAQATQQAARASGKTAALVAQREQLQQRHPLGLDVILAEAQAGLVRAEARRTVAQRALPEHAEKLPERTARAARAAQEIEAEYQRLLQEHGRLRTLLEERGGEGLFTRLQEAEEQLEAAQREAEALRRDGLGARLLVELIQRREQQSIQAVLRPLEDRLTAAFASLTGEAKRRVWFDEHLAILGVGSRREELTPFESMSRGAREQLLLALRAAIALEVATDDPPCLVLDDVLVHTDAARHENVLEFLQQLASTVQIILLTCHAERYRGFGTPIPISRPALDRD